MKNALPFRCFNLFASLIVFAAGQVMAATHYVTVDDSGFSPNTLTIDVGDTVNWENMDMEDFPHTTTSDPSVAYPDNWDYLLVGLGENVNVTFNDAGTFTYHDTAGTGTGTIIVNQPVLSVITLESPRLAGGQFVFGATGLTVGKTNVLETSTNLTSWVAVQTNVADNVSLTLTNTVVLPRQFFRLVQLP